MLNEQTLTQLRSLRLDGMVAALADHASSSAASELRFEERLAREFTPVRLEAACTRAMAIRSPNLRSVTSILRSGLDRQPVPPKPVQASLPLHENLRGPDYYH